MRQYLSLPQRIYDIFHAHYGNLNWWPACTPYEVMVGAILTQNTAWSNVERALANFGDEPPVPERIAALTHDALAEYIRPAGFFNQKARYLQTLTRWYARYGYDVQRVSSQPLWRLREELLALRGVGEETADSILLYAFGLPTFVVDAYTKRLLTRIDVDVPMKYGDIKEYFESQLPRDVSLYNNYHACIVINAKTYCKAKPKCDGCPLHQTICYYLEAEKDQNA